MSVKDAHPSYIEILPDWELVTDSLAERTVKSGQTRYLPRTSGQESFKQQNSSDAAYQAYMSRANYPEIVSPAITGLTGIAHRLPSALEAPERFVEFTQSITTDAKPLDELSRKAVRQVLAHGRYGMLSDVDDTGEPYIATYRAESIINWKTDYTSGREVLSLVVLKESVSDAKDEFGNETKDRYRVLKLVDGVYIVELYDEGGILIQPLVSSTADNRNLDYIPFVFIGSTDLTPDIDTAPMLPLSKSAIRIYQLDADYRQSLHMTSEPTPVISGVDDEDINSIGSAVLWKLSNPESKAYYLEVSGTGIEAQRTAIQDTLLHAAKVAGELTQDGGQKESGEAIRLRMFNRHASLFSVSKTVGAGIQKALEYCADMVGIDPNAITYTPNLDFTGSDVSDTLVNVLNNAVNAGNMSKPMFWEVLRTADLTDKEDDQISDEIAEDGMAVASE